MPEGDEEGNEETDLASPGFKQGGGSSLGASIVQSILMLLPAADDADERDDEDGEEESDEEDDEDDEEEERLEVGDILGDGGGAKTPFLGDQASASGGSPMLDIELPGDVLA